MPKTFEPTFEGDITFSDEPFALENGEELSSVTLHYAVYGTLNEKRDNAILVCHALSGSARVADWWGELFGDDAVFDLEKHCIIGINVIGSCYGSTGPSSINLQTGTPYGRDFPVVTIRDLVRGHTRVLDHLGIERLRVCVGGSIGGMQALQLAVDFPERVERTVLIGAAPLSAMGLALNHLQRWAILNDKALNQDSLLQEPATQQPSGLALARAIAMCSYKSAELFDERFGRKPNRAGNEDPLRSINERYDVGGYLDYQGEIFTRRFDADTYLIITKLMDSFDPVRGYLSEEEAFARIKAKCLFVGISSDWLFPAKDVEALVQKIKACGGDVIYKELESSHGHDGFLADADVLQKIIQPFINEAFIQKKASSAKVWSAGFSLSPSSTEFQAKARTPNLPTT